MNEKIHWLRAKKALDDSIGATFSLMHSSDYAVDWRHNFIVAITTLRATGHVLRKVDCTRFPEIVDCVSKKYERWKQGKGDDVLFVHFIEDTRNVLLKTYQFPNDEALCFKEEELGPDEDSLDTVKDGPFQREDVCGLLHHSQNWWLRELSEVSEKIETPLLKPGNSLILRTGSTRGIKSE